MKIAEMRPKELYDKVLQLRAKCGHEFYLKESSAFIETPCPACGKTDTTFAFRKYGFFHQRCESCDTLFASPRPVDDQLKRYYSEYEAPLFWTEILLASNDKRKKLQHQPRVELLRKVLNEQSARNERKQLVDLGAGSGLFAETVQESGLFESVVANDISSACIEACKKRGLKTHLGFLEDFPENSIDFVTCNDLVEHLHNPSQFLAGCYARLKSGGGLMIATPNGAGFDFSILGDKTENISPPEHLQYFNPHSISLLLEECGYRVISVQTPGILDVQIVKTQVSEGNFPLLAENAWLAKLFKRNDEKLEEAFQGFLRENLLSSHMVVVAEKK